MKSKVSIVSNNCWGAEYYIEHNLEYNTPFVGLFVPPICFAKLCNNLPDYLSKDLIFVESSKYDIYNKLLQQKKYPIALLDDVEIHFLHYKSSIEAKEKWERRLSRMSFEDDSLRVKACDREVDDWPAFTELWNKIPHKKIFFSAKKRKDIENLVFISQFSKQGEVIDGKALYDISKNYFNIVDWINTGKIKVKKLFTVLKQVI